MSESIVQTTSNRIPTAELEGSFHSGFANFRVAIGEFR